MTTQPSGKSGKGAFTRFALATSMAAGSAPAFMIAIGVVIVWAVSGPLFHFSDIWQMVINTGTTIITFLMIFVIQNAQNRDGKLVQLKLDELLRAVEAADTAYIAMDEMCEADLEQLRSDFRTLATQARGQGQSPQTGVKAARVKALANALRSSSTKTTR